MKSTPIRLPEPLLARVDAIVERLRQDPGASVDRSKIVRLAVARGLDVLEADAVTPPKRASRA
jgi:hypothetical protein